MSAADKEIFKRYEQDLVIIAKKLADCQGEAVSSVKTQPESSFVSNLRNSITSAGNDYTAARLDMLEKIITKMSELDRVILKKTDVSMSTGRARRKSKDGSDLFSMPTHLMLVDRLLDVFAMSQRLQIVEKQRSDSGFAKKEVEEKNKEIGTLKRKLAESQMEMTTMKEKVANCLAEMKMSQKNQNADEASPTLTVSGDGKAIVTTQVDEASSLKELSELKKKLSSADQTIRDMEERMEIMASSEQSIVNAIVSITFAISNTQEIPSSESLQLKFLNKEAKQATDHLLAAITNKVGDKSRTMEQQFNDAKQDNQLLKSEFDTHKSFTDKEIAQKNAEILSLQDCLGKANNAKKEADKLLEEAKERASSARQELIEDYEGKIQKFRADSARVASMKRQMEKATAKSSELEKRCSTLEEKNLSLSSTVDSLKSDLIAQEKINKNLLNTIKKMSDDSNKNDFADTFEEVMREEMMAMKQAFETKLKIARHENEILTRKHQTEISRIETSQSTTGLR